MEREACVCDHGFERSDLCAEIIILIITYIHTYNGWRTIGEKSIITVQYSYINVLHVHTPKQRQRYILNEYSTQIIFPNRRLDTFNFYFVLCTTY